MGGKANTVSRCQARQCGHRNWRVYVLVGSGAHLLACIRIILKVDELIRTVAVFNPHFQYFYSPYVNDSD